MMYVPMWVHAWMLVAGVGASGQVRTTRAVIRDPYASTPQIIRADGYPVETHRVTTADGYILQLHRIPAGGRPTRRADVSRKGKRAVILVHGLVGSGADFVLLGPKKSLAYMLADSGYDVWIGNLRGTTYSTHTYLSKNDTTFWNFSFEEHGKYDITSSIDHILSTTGLRQLLYVGFSMGTTSFFIMMAERPEYASKLVGFVGLAPAVYLNNIRPLARVIVERGHWTEALRQEGLNSISIPRWLRDISTTVCNIPSRTNMCANLLFSVVGEDLEQIDYETLAVAIARSEPASIRQLEHYAKIALTGEFLPWGRGLRDTRIPPFNIFNITVPIHLYFGLNDQLTEKTETLRLARVLRLPSSSLHPVPWKSFNHLDFVYAKHVDTLLNKDVVNKIKELYNTQHAS